MAEEPPAHSIYLHNSVSADLLIAQASGFSAAVQKGAVVRQGATYLHSSGFTAGIYGGFGFYNKGINDEFVINRGFTYVEAGIEAGYRGSIKHLSWTALLGAAGHIAEYEASVQQFFFPSITLTGGIGFSGLHAVYLTLPVTLQFRQDLDLSLSTGLGIRLYLNALPSLFRSKGQKP
ncbi:MAG: hypothetical protein JXB03_10535 [Spirochaetales bacterium]|nr:hypothetical protein [Spirochaetales bacterium]